VKRSGNEGREGNDVNVGRTQAHGETAHHRPLSAAGIDVSDWGKFAGSEKRAASNPKYCYEWSFLKPGSLVVLNLWYRSLSERNGIVSADLNLRKSVRGYAEGGTGVWRTRAEKLDLAIQDAAKNLLPVRVIINDGKMRAADDLSAHASRVERRLLDPVPWAVTSYDWKTGGRARFPVVKSLDTFEFLSIPSVNKALVDRVRYSVPAGNPEMPGLLAQLRQGRDEVKRLLRQLANWPPESLDAQRRFGQPHARLSPFLGRKVWTPEGAGTLLQVFADRVIVLLDSELPLCSPFSTEHIEPVSPLERLE
jgi:hypothetical protein